MTMKMVLDMYAQMGVDLKGKPPVPTITGKIYLRETAKVEGDDRQLFMAIGVIAVPEGIIVGDGSDGEGGDGRMMIIAGHPYPTGDLMIEMFQSKTAWDGIDEEDRNVSGDTPSGILRMPIWRI